MTRSQVNVRLPNMRIEGPTTDHMDLAISTSQEYRVMVEVDVEGILGDPQIHQEGARLRASIENLKHLDTDVLGERIETLINETYGLRLINMGYVIQYKH